MVLKVYLNWRLSSRKKGTVYCMCSPFSLPPTEEQLLQYILGFSSPIALDIYIFQIATTNSQLPTNGDSIQNKQLTVNVPLNASWREFKGFIDLLKHCL